MDSQLNDQWNAVVATNASGDRLLQARLQVELARLLLEEASGLKGFGPDPDSRVWRVLSQWAQTAKLLADYLPPVATGLQEQLAVFKTEVLAHTQAVAEAAHHLEQAQTAFEHLRPEYEALSAREAELRNQQTALDGLNVHYQALAALDARIAPMLTELRDRQAALPALWSALAEAEQHLQAQRELLHAHFQADRGIAEGLARENALLGQLPSEAIARAIGQINHMQQALAQLDHLLSTARNNEQEQLEQRRRARL